MMIIIIIYIYIDILEVKVKWVKSLNHWEKNMAPTLGVWYARLPLGW